MIANCPHDKSVFDVERDTRLRLDAPPWLAKAALDSQVKSAAEQGLSSIASFFLVPPPKLPKDVPSLPLPRGRPPKQIYKQRGRPSASSGRDDPAPAETTRVPAVYADAEGNPVLLRR